MKMTQLLNTNTILDNNKIKYKCGETISGTVIIALNGELDLSRLSIVLRSLSEVKWVENYGRLPTVYINEGYEYHDIEDNLIVAYEIPDTLRHSVITAGEHSIPFLFELPKDISSSVDTALGNIKYWIEVIICDDSSKKEDYIDRKYFTVESPLRESLHISVGGGTEKGLGLLNLGSGKLRIDASIRKKGHIKGETVEVHCLVTNTSSVAVTPRAHFFQTQIFMAKERHKTLEGSSDPVFGVQVMPGQTEEQTILVQIPKIIPLSLTSRLITIKYYVHITLDIPHAYDLHLNLPIIITNEYALNDRK